MENEDIKKVKSKSDEPMKIYDKEIYKNQEKIKSTILVIAVFVIGFLSGYLCEFGKINKLEKKVEEQEVQINQISSIQ